MVSPLHKRRAVREVTAAGLCSQRRACRYLELHRSSGRYQNRAPSEWMQRLRQRLEALSHRHARLGYRKLTRMLRAEGWTVGKKLVQRLRRDCGLRGSDGSQSDGDEGRPPARSRRGPSGSTTFGAGTSWPTAPTTAGGCASCR